MWIMIPEIIQFVWLVVTHATCKIWCYTVRQFLFLKMFSILSFAVYVIPDASITPYEIDISILSP
jgi:hypothetical protein